MSDKTELIKQKVRHLSDLSMIVGTLLGHEDAKLSELSGEFAEAVNGLLVEIADALDELGQQEQAATAVFNVNNVYPKPEPEHGLEHLRSMQEGDRIRVLSFTPDWQGGRHMLGEYTNDGGVDSEWESSDGECLDSRGIGKYEVIHQEAK